MTVACPICGENESVAFWPRVWGASSDKAIRLCPTCRSYFQWPPNSPEEQTAFDRQYDSYISNRAAEVSVHNDTAFDELVDDSIEERWNDIGHFFAGARSVLEIGAEKGGFLDRLRQSGIMDLVGVDACPEYTHLLKRKGYQAHAYLEQVPADSRFDRICLFSLLEHVADPVAFLRIAANLLTVEGRIVLEVPSARDPLIELYDVPAFKDFYFQAMHPYVYGIEAIQIILERAGLRCEEIRYKQRYGLSNHLQWLKAGVPGGSSRFSSIFIGAAEDGYTTALEASGITDTVYIVAGR